MWLFAFLIYYLLTYQKKKKKNGKVQIHGGNINITIGIPKDTLAYLKYFIDINKYPTRWYAARFKVMVSIIDLESSKAHWSWHLKSILGNMQNIPFKRSK